MGDPGINWECYSQIVARRQERVKPVEQSRTRAARREVVSAAAVLFVEQGYAMTTIAAISERSGVPQATVYRLFGSKPEILKTWLDVAIAGDDEPIAVADRPQVSALMSEPDPRQVIAGFVGVAAAVNRRAADVYRVLVGAAETDSVAAELLRDIQRQRAAGQRGLSSTLARLSALRDGLTTRHAADVVHAIASPETFRLLVVDRGWAQRRYEQWLQTTLCQQLLGEGSWAEPQA